MLIPEVERKIEQLYDDISIPQELHDAIEEELKGMIEKEKAKAEFKGISPVDAFCDLHDARL